MTEFFLYDSLLFCFLLYFTFSNCSSKHAFWFQSLTMCTLFIPQYWLLVSMKRHGYSKQLNNEWVQVTAVLIKYSHKTVHVLFLIGHKWNQAFYSSETDVTGYCTCLEMFDCSCFVKKNLAINRIWWIDLWSNNRDKNRGQ